eukprot:GHVU01160334.1.p1 GENE.GHVU01160334.1~~GHVU01160334.1.p1  ORF type:complete len:126 (+),score=2.50 GHVU01160334.1:31-378(+)
MSKLGDTQTAWSSHVQATASTRARGLQHVHSLSMALFCLITTSQNKGSSPPRADSDYPPELPIAAVTLRIDSIWPSGGRRGKDFSQKRALAGAQNRSCRRPSSFLIPEPTGQHEQ